MSKEKMNNKGSLWLESLIIINLLIPLTSLGLIILYVSFANFWLHHSLYEAILCKAKAFSNPRVCQKELKERIENFLTLGKLKNISLKEKKTSFDSQIKWTFLNLDLIKKLSIEKKKLKRSLKIKKALL